MASRTVRRRRSKQEPENIDPKVAEKLIEGITLQLDSLETLELQDIPCLVCDFLETCGGSQNKSPQGCEKLTRWLLEKSEKN